MVLCNLDAGLAWFNNAYSSSCCSMRRRWSFDEYLVLGVFWSETEFSWWKYSTFESSTCCWSPKMYSSLAFSFSLCLGTGIQRFFYFYFFLLLIFIQIYSVSCVCHLVKVYTCNSTTPSTFLLISNDFHTCRFLLYRGYIWYIEKIYLFLSGQEKIFYKVMSLLPTLTLLC